MSRREHARTKVAEAARLEAAGSYAKAAAAYREALDVEPADLDAACRLARCYEAVRSWTRAVEAWRHAVELRPARLDLIIGLAEALRQARCHLAALDAYARALEIDDEHLFALAGRGETLRMLGRFTESLRWFDAALDAHPEHAFALRGKAAALNALSRFSDAEALWSRALELDASSTFARQGLEETRRRRREVGDAPEGIVLEPPTPGEARLQAERWLEWGKALVRDDRLQEAAEALRQSTEADPHWTKSLSERGRMLESLSEWEKACEVYATLSSLDPDRLDARCSLAECLRKAERYGQALEAYNTVLSDDPDYVFALAGRAEALRMMGHNEDALDGFDAALARKPTHAFALRGKAATLNALHRYGEAAGLWQRSLDLDPGNAFAQAGLAEAQQVVTEGRQQSTRDPARSRARAHHDMGRAYLQQGRYREAIQALRKAAEVDPQWHEPWFLQGVAWQEERQYTQAVRAFEGCLEREPDHVEARVHKAECLRKHNDLPSALEAYQAAASLAPEDLRVLAGRAETLRLLGRFEEAIDAFDRVLTAKPRHYFSLCGKAAALNALHRFTEAKPLWLKAREENPSSSFVKRGLAHCVARSARERRLSHDELAARAALDRGRSAQKSGDRETAVTAFQEALELDPSCAEAALRLGIVFEDQRRFDEAIDAYERCLALDPGSHQAATNIGEAHRKSESYHDAVTAYDRALALRPDYLYALAGRAECMRMLGQYKDSLTWFDRALAQEPSHAFAIQGKAASLNALHRFAEAMPLWEKAIEIDGQSQFALDGKAFCEAQLRRLGVKRPGVDNASQDSESDSEEPESATPTLDEQARDLSALAESGELGEVIGRKMEIRAVMKTLVRKQKANPLLIGDPGVGKTAVVEGLAQALVSDDVPRRLTGLRILELSMGTLVAGTKYRGTFEDRLKKIVEEARENPGIVLFIDEIHTLVGAGRTEGGSLDAANILKPALARGEITIIGATTVAEYRKHIESDSALERRFQPVNIEEPSEEDALELLRRVSHRYAEHHEVEIDDAALRACVRLSVRFVPDRRLPDKALDLLDEAAAEASLSDQPVVTSTVVAQVLSERTGIPAGQLTAEERQRLVHLEEHLGAVVKGQDHAVERLARTVRLARSGLRDPRRPRGVFLFAGPSGVGKTELARQLSDHLFPEGNAFVRFDMSEFSDKFTMSRLIGAPPGYAGHGEPGQLTGKLRRRPYAVVLLDEFEKAHPDVQTLFLSLFDEGHVTDAEGREVDAREALFILTSNAGSAAALKGRLGFGSTREGLDVDLLIEQIKGRFRPELLNRIDDIVPFGTLAEPALRDVVALHLGHLAGRALDAGTVLTWDDSVVSACADPNLDPQYGARPALRAIDTLVGEPLGNLLLSKRPDERRALHASMQDGEVVFTEPVGQAQERAPLEEV